jgi:hypothetical protein
MDSGGEAIVGLGVAERLRRTHSVTAGSGASSRMRGAASTTKAALPAAAVSTYARAASLALKLRNAARRIAEGWIHPGKCFRTTCDVK